MRPWPFLKILWEITKQAMVKSPELWAGVSITSGLSVCDLSDLLRFASPCFFLGKVEIMKDLHLRVVGRHWGLGGRWSLHEIMWGKNPEKLIPRVFSFPPPHCPSCLCWGPPDGKTGIWVTPGQRPGC